MMRSLFSGVAGLKTHQTKMDVIGNNIANVNTTGFKSGRVTFQDTLNQTLTSASAATDTRGGTNPKQIGLGVGLGSVDTIFTDGSVQSTGKNTDLCISGSGLFVVKSGQGTFYTRNGAFEFDEAGNYVMPGSGMFVQGWTASNGVLNTNGAAANITIQAGKSMAAAETTTGTYSKNIAANTKGAAITNLQVAYTDGTTESVTNYSPTSAENATIKLTLADGRTVSVAAGGPYVVGSNYTGPIYGPNVVSITANATGGTVDLTLGGLNSGDTGVFDPPTMNGLTSGTYKADDTYTKTQTITGVTTDPVAKTVTLYFTNDGTATGTVGAGEFKSVTIPQPASGTYTINDSFTVNKKITKATALAGADLSLVGGQTVTGSANASTTGASYTETIPAPGVAINSVTRTGGTTSYTYNGKTVKSVSAVLADGTTSTALSGTNYAAGSTFYPSITTTISAHDSLGNEHTIPVLFTKTSENTWGLSLPGGGKTYTMTEEDGSTTIVNLTATDLKFSNGGAYLSGTASLASTFTNGAAASNITINLSALTQYSGSSTLDAKADGNAAGTLKSVAIDSAGVITGTYTNGVNQAEAQVAMAQFNNPAGLTKSGSSLYVESNNSGKANVKTASALGVTITPSSLEMSNVDLSNEFSDMIITQRGFQSNSKIITVSDEMLETLIGMKR